MTVHFGEIYRRNFRGVVCEEEGRGRRAEVVVRDLEGVMGEGGGVTSAGKRHSGARVADVAPPAHEPTQRSSAATIVLIYQT